MPVWSGVGLACKIAFDSCRVVDVVADHCMMEDRVDRCSS